MCAYARISCPSGKIGTGDGHAAELELRRPDLAVGLIAGSNPAFANVLDNGSFETGDFTGWATGGNFEDVEVTSSASLHL